MLILTDRASDVIRSISDGPDIPDSAGLRIAAMPGDDPALSAMPVASPEAGDQIVEHEGARVFLDDMAASQLDDRVLDAVVDHDHVEFLIREQPGGPGMDGDTT